GGHRHLLPVSRFVLGLRGMPARSPTAAQQGGHQQAAFVQEKQARTTTTRFLLDARPVLSQPPGNGLLVPFTRHAPGLLRRVAPLPQPSAQVVRIAADAELLLDEAGAARRGPKVGGKAVLGGQIGQPTEDDFLLGMGKLGRTTRAGSGPASQAVVSTRAR